jgi:hypothetical protein
MKDELFQVKCSDGRNVWLAYNGLPFSKARAEAEAEQSKAQWPTNTYEVIPYGSLDPKAS